MGLYLVGMGSPNASNDSLPQTTEGAVTQTANQSRTARSLYYGPSFYITQPMQNNIIRYTEMDFYQQATETNPSIVQALWNGVDLNSLLHEVVNIQETNNTHIPFSITNLRMIYNNKIISGLKLEICNLCKCFVKIILRPKDLNVINPVSKYGDEGVVISELIEIGQFNEITIPFPQEFSNRLAKLGSLHNTVQSDIGIKDSSKTPKNTHTSDILIVISKFNDVSDNRSTVVQPIDCINVQPDTLYIAEYDIINKESIQNHSSSDLLLHAHYCWIGDEFFVLQDVYGYTDELSTKSTESLQKLMIDNNTKSNIGNPNDNLIGNSSDLNISEETRNERAERMLSLCTPDCVICLSDSKEVIVLPCRHLCMCEECANVYRFQNPKCPICRQDYSSLIRIVF